MSFRAEFSSTNKKSKPVVTLTSPASFKGYQAPRGFISNMSSTPETFFKDVGFSGSTLNIAVVHDYLYGKKNKPRKQIDLLLKEGLKDAGIGFFKRWVIYLVCRLFGNKLWENSGRPVIGRP